MAAALPGAPQRQQLGVAPQQLPPSIDVASGGRTNVNIPAPPELFQGVQLPGLPFSATEDDIRAFLVRIGSRLVPRRGIPKGKSCSIPLDGSRKRLVFFFLALSTIVGLAKKKKTHVASSLSPNGPRHHPLPPQKNHQAPTECVDVLLVNRSGLPSGEAFVVLGGGPAALLSAVSRNKQYLGPWYIEVFAARRGDYYRAAAAEVEREDLKMAAAAATAAASGGSLSLPPPPPLLSGPASPAAVAVSSSSAAAAAAAASSSATLQISPRELREQLQQFAQLQQQQALWMLCGGVGGKQHQMREQEQQQQHFDQGTATIPPPPPQLSESLLALAALPVPPPISSVPFVPVTPPPPTLSTVAALAAVNATSEKARAASVAASARASASAAASPSGLKIIFGSGESLSGCLSSGNGGNNSDAGGSGGGGGSRGKTAATAMATTANAASGTTVLRLRGLPFSADEDDIIAWIAEHCAEKKEKKICSGRGGRNCGSDSGGSNCGSGSDSSPLPHSPLPPTSSASSPKEQQQQQHLSTVRTFIYLLRSREGKSSGQAHVSFESSEAAEVVARACDHAHFGQRYIEVSWVRFFFRGS